MNYTDKSNTVLSILSRPGRTYDEHRQHIFATTGKRMKPLNGNESDASTLHSISGVDLLSSSSEAKQFAVEYLLPSQGIVMICGPEGSGKSKLVMNLACCLATGRRFLDKFEVSKKHRVFIVDGEMTKEDNHGNFAKTARGLGLDEDEMNKLAGRFTFMLATENDAAIDISNAADQAEIKSHSRNSDVIIFDSIVTLDQSGSPNFQKSWLRIQPFLNRLKAAGKAIILLHHTTKGGDILGSVRLGIHLDTVIMLKKPHDYKAEDGIHNVVSFKKFRNFTGGAAKEFEVQMLERDRAFIWPVDGGVHSSQEDKILDLMADGMNKTEAIKAVGISTSTFYNGDNSMDDKLKKRYDDRREAGTIEPIQKMEKGKI